MNSQLSHIQGAPKSDYDYPSPRRPFPPCACPPYPEPATKEPEITEWVREGQEKSRRKQGRAKQGPLSGPRVSEPESGLSQGLGENFKLGESKALI